MHNVQYWYVRTMMRYSSSLKFRFTLKEWGGRGREGGGRDYKNMMPSIGMVERCVVSGVEDDGEDV